ncbi:MAG: hypothetical protein HMLKMBBP_03445 [Planctomycetes bacterium]|nr:hypothetical protein [Planctomycetota bacterium]
MPAVALLGPRQSGKTTLLRASFPDLPYVSLEAPDLREEASADPRGFLRRHPGGAVLDEVQRTPRLLGYLMGVIDEDPSPGRWILGSSLDLLLLPSVSQSLAGRMAFLRLPPLSLRELRGHPPCPPARWHEPDFERAPGREPTGPWAVLHSGFYPRVHASAGGATAGGPPAGDGSAWLTDYVRTYVGRDLREIVRVSNQDTFERFLRLVAARTGQELNLNELAADAGVSQPTAASWISALRAGFVVTLLPPFRAPVKKRLRKRAKLHFTDTGLVCHLLGIRDAATLASHPLRGAVFESFVVSELAKAFHAAGADAPLFHWRDASGVAVDALADMGGRVLAVDAVSGATVTAESRGNLRRWRETPGVPPADCLIVHGGDSVSESEGIAARPWHSV